MSGSITNQFKVIITGSSTETLQGKYTQQPVVLDYNGKEYRAGQGNILIIGRNATV
jgi:hypothetical protein